MGAAPTNLFSSLGSKERLLWAGALFIWTGLNQFFLLLVLDS